MIVPRTVIRYVKSQVFMRSNFLNLLILHENWRMYGFVNFTSNNKRFCFQRINETNQVLAQAETFSRSAFRVSADVCGLSTII